MPEFANLANYGFRKKIDSVGSASEPQRTSYFEGSILLKSFLLILSALIFDSRVDPGTPSLAAAPDGPDTRPPHSRKAASMMAFS